MKKIQKTLRVSGTSKISHAITWQEEMLRVAATARCEYFASVDRSLEPDIREGQVSTATWWAKDQWPWRKGTETKWKYLPYIFGLFFKAYVREYPHKIWLYMVQYLHFRILEFPLKGWEIIFWTHSLILRLGFEGKTGDFTRWNADNEVLQQEWG